MNSSSINTRLFHQKQVQQLILQSFHLGREQALIMLLYTTESATFAGLRIFGVACQIICLLKSLIPLTILNSFFVNASRTLELENQLDRLFFHSRVSNKSTLRCGVKSHSVPFVHDMGNKKHITYKIYANQIHCDTIRYLTHGQLSNLPPPASLDSWKENWTGIEGSNGAAMLPLK